MRIVTLGDSLGLPRPHRIGSYSPDEKTLAVAYNETYSSILQKSLIEKFQMTPYVEVINRSKRFYNIKNVHDEFVDHLYFFEPEIIILQVGIVDCWIREELNGNQMVNISDFKHYFDNMRKMLLNRPKCKLIIIGICPTSIKMEKRHSGINRQISLYNNILKSAIDNQSIFYIDMEKNIHSENTKEYLLPDDHHLNKNGNLLVSKMLFQIVNAFLLNNQGVNLYKNNEQVAAFKIFYESFKIYPNYADNLYNLISLSHILDEIKIKKEVIEYAKNKFIKDSEINELILQVNKLTNNAT